MNRNNKFFLRFTAWMLGVLFLGIGPGLAETGEPAGTNPAPSSPSPDASNPGQQPVTRQAARYLVVSVSDFGAGSWDIKLKSFATGYVHSLTMILVPPIPFEVGQTVRQIDTSDGRVYLQLNGRRYLAASPGAR